MEEKTMLNRRNALRTMGLWMMILAMVFSLAACSADAEMDSSDSYYDDNGVSYDKSEDSMGSLLPEVAPMPEAAPSPDIKPTAPDSDGAAAPSTGESGVEYQTKIIRTVTQRAQTKSFDAAVASIESLVPQYGGYVESSHVNGTGYNGNKGSRSANYTIRIPAEQLDAFLSAAGELYVVAYSNSTVSNVTAQYYDIVTRLETLRAEQESLEGMLKEAKDISTMLQIKDYLYQVIYEIESYETQLKLLDSRVSYSTLHLTVDEVVEYNTEVEQSWGERLVAAFKQSWVAFGRGFQGFTVFLVAAFPTLMVLGAIAAVIIVIVVKVNKKHSPKQPPKDGE
jgi:hypothetical protein